MCAAPPVSRRHSRSSSHSACQAPAERSSSVSRHCVSAAASSGTWRAARADQGGQHRVALVRHRRGGAAARPRPARRPRRSRCGPATARRPRSCRAPPVGEGERGRQVGDRGAQGVPGQRGRASPVSAAKASVSRSEVVAGPSRRSAPPSTAAYSRYPARVPAAPPSETGRPPSRTRSSRSAASRTSCRQPAALSPKVVGTACRARVRPAIEGVPVPRGEPGQRRRRVRSQVGADQASGRGRRPAWRRCPGCPGWWSRGGRTRPPPGPRRRPTAVSAWTRPTTGLAVSRAARARARRSNRSARAGRR